MYYPVWLRLVAKKKGNKLYYYVVESARVDGKPRIVHQAYLGTAEKVAELVRDRTAPVPLAATTREFGLPAALWAGRPANRRLGLAAIALACADAPAPRPLTTCLLAAIHRICQPGPKTEVADWYRSSILSTLLGDSPRALYFASLLGCVRTDPAGRPRSALRGRRSARSKPSCVCWEYGKRNNWSVVVCWPTTPPTSTPISPAPTRATNLAQRGHNKQGRHNLRQVGLSYVLDGEHGLSLCHHVYPGNVADVRRVFHVVWRASLPHA